MTMSSSRKPKLVPDRSSRSGGCEARGPSWRPRDRGVSSCRALLRRLRVYLVAQPRRQQSPTLNFRFAAYRRYSEYDQPCQSAGQRQDASLEARAAYSATPLGARIRLRGMERSTANLVVDLDSILEAARRESRRRLTGRRPRSRQLREGAPSANFAGRWPSNVVFRDSTRPSCSPKIDSGNGSALKSSSRSVREIA